MPAIFCNNHFIGQILKAQPQLTIIQRDVQVAFHAGTAICQRSVRSADAVAADETICKIAIKAAIVMLLMLLLLLLLQVMWRRMVAAAILRIV